MEKVSGRKSNTNSDDSQHLQRLKQILHVIRSISHLTLKANNRRELLQGICDLLTEEGGYYNVWIALLDRKGCLSETYESGLGKEFSELALRLKDGKNITCSKIVLHEKTFWSTENPSTVCSDCNLSQRYSNYSAFSARLAYETEFSGMITASIPKGYHSFAPERELFCEVVDDIALALHNLRVRENLRQSEEKYRSLYDNAPLAYQSLDPNGNYLDINSTWLKMFGYTRNEVIGKSFVDFMHPDWVIHFQEKFPHFLQSGHVDDAQFRLRHSKGHYIDISLKGHVAYNSDGSIRQTYCVFHDITVEKQTQEKLKKEKERASNILQGTNAGTWDWNIVTGELILNERWAEIIGYTLDELQPISVETWSQSVHPDDLQIAETALKKLLEQELDYYDVEFRQLHKEGHFIWVNARGKVIKWNEDSQPLHISGTHLDITKRKLAEEERIRLMRAIEQTTDAVAITDARGMIQYVNDAFEAVTGYARDETLGRPSRLLKNAKRDLLVYKSMVKTLLRGKSWSSRLVDRQKDGSFFTIDVAISPVQNRFGKTVNYVAVARDVTQEIKLENQLRQSDKMKALGQLASGIAHDFANILGGILGYAEFVLDEAQQDSELEEFANEILTGVDRATHLVRQILSFARQTEEKRVPTFLKPIVKEALQLLRATLPASIKISSDLHKENNPVLTDPTRIHEIVMNLCTNAAHAMNDKGTLQVSCTQEDVANTIEGRIGKSKPGRYTILTIADNGSGMEKEVLEHLFEPFFTTKPVGEGTGMGLAVVYGIAQSHNCNITVESSPGQGSSFRIYLPTTEAEVNEKKRNRKSPPRGTERVLIVDDEPALLRLMSRMLSQLGYTVASYSESQEALNVFHSKPDFFDLVITDMTMPKISGFELAHEISRIRQEIPILLCTGDSKAVDKGRHPPGWDGEILMKPVSMTKLAFKVRELLNGTKT